MPQLPGLYKHCSILTWLVEAHLPKLAHHFEQNNIHYQMFASEWIFGLFASVIPIEQMSNFFNRFFKDQWVFYYQLILSILKEHETELLADDDLYSILNIIKPQTNGSTAAAALSQGASFNQRLKVEEHDCNLSMDANTSQMSDSELEVEESKVMSFFQKLNPWKKENVPVEKQTIT